MHQVLLKITGRVQGVFYRDSARQTAEKLNLAGYAKNMPDGHVEALVRGEKQHILEFIKWCAQGPPSSKVENVQTTWQTPKKEYADFKVL